MWGDKCVTMRRKLFDVYPFVPFDFGINDCTIMKIKLKIEIRCS